jgi:hypothetical protein
MNMPIVKRLALMDKEVQDMRSGRCEITSKMLWPGVSNSWECEEGCDVPLLSAVQISFLKLHNKMNSFSGQ